MGKIALMFPGQGAQHVGMGKELYTNYQSVKNTFDSASEHLGYDLTNLCFYGPGEKLQLTEVTQPAMLTFGVAVAEILKNQGVEIEAYAGLSLGEYGALVMADALDFKAGVKLVEKRGKFMQDAVPIGIGTMVAIIGLDNQKVEQICKRASEKGVVEISNYNCPGQVVIGGEVKAIEYASQLAKEDGARKVIPLQVSAPFHTSMLASARNQLKTELDSINFKPLKHKVLSSVTADYIDDYSQIPQILADQVCSSVRWEQVVRRFIADDYQTFITLGPGKSLKGFISRINKKAEVITIDNYESLQKGLERLLNNGK